jgi:hypothetical protein
VVFGHLFQCMNRKEIFSRTDEGTEAAERTFEHRDTILSSVGTRLPKRSVRPCSLTPRVTCGPDWRGACASCKRRDGTDRQVAAAVSLRAMS